MDGKALEDYDNERRLKMIVWKVTRNSERKIREGHPWVFSNELERSPKSVDPGQLIELHSWRGEFLGWGYGHPNSLISFRFLGREKASVNLMSPEFFAQRFAEALTRRKMLGATRSSFRLIFAEGDQLPGLIVDRYLVSLSDQHQVFSVQISTAGMERYTDSICQGLQLFIERSGLGEWKKTAIMLCPDSPRRVLEGLPKKEKYWRKDPDFSVADAFVSHSLQDQAIPLSLDFLTSQKTGVFLDQCWNIALVMQILARTPRATKDPVRVLDLFCYLGHWGTQAAHLFSSQGIESEITPVDASMQALEWAEKNITRVGGRTTPLKMDIPAHLSQWDEGPFDVVICDPPAFAKKRKDLPTAMQAYTKLNREALKKVKEGGIFVTCSCSGLLSTEAFTESVQKAALQARRSVQWLSSGGLSWDHPISRSFPEGNYLKAWIGRVC